MPVPPIRTTPDEEVIVMERDELLGRLKSKLRETSFDAPAVETVQPEIRSAAQYAMMPSMRAGFRIDDEADNSTT